MAYVSPGDRSFAETAPINVPPFCAKSGENGDSDVSALALATPEEAARFTPVLSTPGPKERSGFLRLSFMGAVILLSSYGSTGFASGDIVADSLDRAFGALGPPGETVLSSCRGGCVTGVAGAGTGAGAIFILEAAGGSDTCCTNGSIFGLNKEGIYAFINKYPRARDAKITITLTNIYKYLVLYMKKTLPILPAHLCPRKEY